MGFSFSNIFGKPSQDLHPKDSVKAILNEIETEPFGVSEDNVLFAGLNELGGYYFFQSVIIGNLRLKVKTGAQLLFSSGEQKLELQSDMLELQSEHTDVKGRWITKIDFQIEEKDLDQLKKASNSKIEISTQKHSVVFDRFQKSESEQ